MFFNWFLNLLYIYITVFSLYFVLLTAISLKGKRKYRNKYTPKDANICVVVYATGRCHTLDNLVKQLKNQTYYNNRYSIYVILDKYEPSDEGSLLQTEANVQVINIDNFEPVGKSQAYSIIAEKLQDVKELDAYVFLNAKNYVNTDFLTNINFYLTKYNVFNASVNYIQNENMRLWQKVKSVYARYYSQFILKSRANINLTNIINSDAFVIKRELLNKISDFDFRNIMSEVNYSYKLALENEAVYQLDEVNVYTDIENFDFRTPSLTKRLNLFWNNILKIQTFKAKEFLINLTAPNWLTFLLIYLLILLHAYNFPFMVNYSNILISFIVLLIAFCVSTLSAKLYTKEYLYLLLYPILSLYRLVYNFPIIRGIRNFIKKVTRKHNIEKMTIDALVTDGTKNYPCQVEFISDDGLARVAFINNGKKYITKNNHLRMVDAVKELSLKLEDYGLTLKICQCCKYYQPEIDGSMNMLKGFCKCNFPGRVQGDIIPTLIWNTCPNFEKHNIIQLF